MLSGELQRQVLAEMRRRTQRRGVRKRVAFELGVSLSQFNDVMRGRRPPSLRFAIGLGLVRLATGAAEPPAADPGSGSGAGDEWRRDQLNLELVAE